jgi:MSHA biogenesis protein MshJ
MNSYWLLISSKFEALTTRERYLMAGGTLVLLYAVTSFLLVSPIIKRNNSLRAELASDQAQMQTIRQQIAVYTQLQVIDPDAENKQRLATLLARLQQQEHQLTELQAALVKPDDIPNLLRRLLKQNSQLKLIALKTLPVRALLDDDSTVKNNGSDQATATPADQSSSKADAQDDPVFKHGVEITLEGRYLDLLAYVAELEQLPWHLLWSAAELKVDENTTSQWPLSRLKLTVYTLSLDQTWLSI